MVKFIKKNKGQILRVRFVGNKLDKKEIREKRDKYGIDSAFINATEGYWTNGWGVLRAGDDLGQMSDCLVIAEGKTTEEDGSKTIYGKTWSNFNTYMYVDEVEELLTTGYVDFVFWQDCGEGVNFENPYMSK